MDARENLSENDRLTVEHIENVMKNIFVITGELSLRARSHDRSKFVGIEKELFGKLPPKNERPTFDTPEYNALSQGILKPALDHHHQANRHHPEHFKNGIEDMTLVDVIEMFSDWKAAAEDHEKDGNIYKSIRKCSKRFGICEQLMLIFRNTAKMMDEIKDTPK